MLLLKRLTFRIYIYNGDCTYWLQGVCEKSISLHFDLNSFSSSFDNKLFS